VAHKTLFVWILIRHLGICLWLKPFNFLLPPKKKDRLAAILLLSIWREFYRITIF
jgi:hypothetical protein